jgi:hypothetical protein
MTCMTKGNNRFALAYMRHAGQWTEVYNSLSLKERLQAIQDDPSFQP